MDKAGLTEDLRRAVAGDEGALQHLFVHYHRPLLRAIDQRLEAKLRAVLDASDILQEAYVAANRSIASTDMPNLAAFYKWLETIAQHKLVDAERAFRTDKRDVGRVARPIGGASEYADLLQTVAGHDLTPSRTLAREEAGAAVLSCLAFLTADQRRVIRLRFLDGMPVDEVAQRMDKTPGAVHMLCHRGLRELRKHLVSVTRYLSRQ